MGLAQTIQAPVLTKRQTTSSGGLCVTLEMPTHYHFAAGQYLNVHSANGIEVPLSIASAPDSLPKLELHYQPTPDDPLSQAMDACLAFDTLTISQPQGDVRCADANEDLMVIAGGSGASLAFSCAQERAQLDASASTHVLWCVDQEHELYDIEKLNQLTTLHQVIDDRRGPEHSALKLLPTLPLVDVYILSGSPSFVYAMADALADLGIKPSQLRSDVFAYAPRDASLDKG